MATLAACGGGGGGSSSLNTPAGTPPTAAATSVVTTGPITAFGSVYVNGVRYETGNAQIEIDGRAATQAELKVGHVVELKGTRGPNGANASAARIVRRNAVTGPIATIDATTNRITVLGQTVLLTASTSFDDSISPANLSGLKAGDTACRTRAPRSKRRASRRSPPARRGRSWARPPRPARRPRSCRSTRWSSTGRPRR
jgi:hypothetical protein